MLKSYNGTLRVERFSEQLSDIKTVFALIIIIVYSSKLVCGKATVTVL